LSRYSHPCPVCGVLIRGAEVQWYGDTFLCPHCGEPLKYDSKHTASIWVVSILGALGLSWHFGYRGAMLIAVAVGATLLLCAAGVFLVEIFDPSGFKRAESKPSKAFDRTVSLGLVNKTDNAKKKGP
jgi:hypothetical protein